VQQAFELLEESWQLESTIQSAHNRLAVSIGSIAAWAMTKLSDHTSAVLWYGRLAQYESTHVQHVDELGWRFKQAHAFMAQIALCFGPDVFLNLTSHADEQRKAVKEALQYFAKAASAAEQALLHVSPNLPFSQYVSLGQHCEKGDGPLSAQVQQLITPTHYLLLCASAKALTLLSAHRFTALVGVLCIVNQDHGLTLEECPTVLQARRLWALLRSLPQTLQQQAERIAPPNAANELLRSDAVLHCMAAECVFQCAYNGYHYANERDAQNGVVRQLHREWRLLRENAIRAAKRFLPLYDALTLADQQKALRFPPDVPAALWQSMQDRNVAGARSLASWPLDKPEKGWPSLASLQS
jgi:hypothetical protein